MIVEYFELIMRVGSEIHYVIILIVQLLQIILDFLLKVKVSVSIAAAWSYISQEIFRVISLFCILLSERMDVKVGIIMSCYRSLHVL